MRAAEAAEYEAKMNREELMEILPHRGRMLLLDTAVRQEEWAVGTYTVRGDEFFLDGHFPGNPVVPGVILCEILAQSACVLLKENTETGKLPVYTGLDRVRFRSPVRPGDRVEARCRIKKARYPFFFAEGSVTVEGRLCVSAEFSFAMESI